MNSFLSLLIALLVAFAPAAVWAEKADRDKPMNIEADSLVHDELKQVSVFTGRAVLTKGTMILRGSRIEIRQDPDGYQFGIVLPEPNKRAFFRQKREGVDEFMEGEGLRIEYDGRADRIKLIDQAEVRRYRGAVLGDQMTGKLITYDNLTDVFAIDGQRPEDGDKATGGRVRVTLAPRNKTLDKDKK
ncbi:lipopolysaccharide transport periplasmic protein LptA [Limnohabitans sp. TS-CS-82]|uniref:lipopolysaccharide transport periplasmic protein LptA n=1 Tax=Limnohabitans sp. TS-CS-82 TaxID=2094193 RepID=UPI000CF2085F|nr:lipopolysaccharide transport periplasmic protein LptA [Limnohabitans sp. TS-CS-82]PQA83679.1 lipopolysaccharide transport periplasmic protein LptA [Limnohabitans sp. TS-CS-82]